MIVRLAVGNLNYSLVTNSEDLLWDHRGYSERRSEHTPLYKNKQNERKTISGDYCSIQCTLTNKIISNISIIFGSTFLPW